MTAAGCVESMRRVKPIVEEGRVWKKTGLLVLAQSREIAQAVNLLETNFDELGFRVA